MNNPFYLGLQGLALVLIFAPEPITTVPGIWLLGYARAKANGEETIPQKRENTFAHIYDYKLEKVGESTITYELGKRRSGQMPWPTMTTRVYKLPQAWKAYQNGDSQPARPHQLLNGAPLPAKRAGTASGAKQTFYVRRPRTSDSQPASPQLLNGVPLPAKKAHTASDTKKTVRAQQPRTSAPLAELYRAQPVKKPEPVRSSKSASVMQRDQIARMLDAMRYTQSFATASSHRASA